MSGNSNPLARGLFGRSIPYGAGNRGFSQPVLLPFLILIDAFLQHRINRWEFEQAYFQVFAYAPTGKMDDSTYMTLADLFHALEDPADPDGQGGDLDEPTLRKVAQRVFDELSPLV
ncbi:MAG: hypothetical protein KatS3mg015_2188 [Fimbriimonadales bacterium]|nr:MAG: hypothetical protein KatS3mg015_2188 [Fimbriimonadales bacterium]